MEREDFMEDAPKKYFRMTPGQEVRLKNAYIVKCTGCKKDENGVITEVYCEYDANTRSGMPDANRKVKGTLHWVSCNHCLQAEVRLYDRLWKVENPRDELAAIREAKNCEALEANHQSGFFESSAELLYREVCGNLACALIPAIPTHRLFQYRQRLDSGETCIQPHGRIKGYLGQNQ